MKVLPARPHPDHLRRQARDHLRALRRLRPDATLSDARAALADQYGFPSWTELRAEVERRAGAVAEDLDPATAAAVAARFGLGDPVGEVPLVERSAAGPAFRLTGAAGRWLVQEAPELSARPGPPAGELVLCHRDLTPANVRRHGQDDLAVVGWERTGPLPARWELGYVLLQWTTGRDERADAATAAALLADYRAAGGAPEPVDRTLFTAAFTAWPSWTYSRVAASTREPTEARAASEVRQLLRTPPTPPRLDALLPR